MKCSILPLVILSVLFSCSKDGSQPSQTNNFESNGNLLVLCIGDSLEFGIEFNTASNSLDSLPISYFNLSNATIEDNSTIGFEYSPTHDSLFSYLESKDLTSNSVIIDVSVFNSLPFTVNLNLNLKQQIVPFSYDYSTIWEQINSLDAVHFYRNQSPNSKIGFARLVVSQTNVLGLQVPTEKYFVFLQR